MASTISICCLTDPVERELAAFCNKRKPTSNRAVILKLNKQDFCVEIESELDDVDADDLLSALPEHQPRFVIFSKILKHADGRTSYPLALIFSTPIGSPTELQVMYAGSQSHLACRLNIQKVCHVRNIDEITEDFLAKLT